MVVEKLKMKLYGLDKTKLNIEINSIIRIYGFVILALVLLFIFLVTQGNVNPISFLLMVVMPVLVIYTANRSINQRKQLYEGYQLELDDQTLKRIQPGFEDLIIHRAEVKSVAESPLGLIVTTEKSANLLAVARELSDQDYNEIKKILSGWVSGDNSLLSEENS